MRILFSVLLGILFLATSLEAQVISPHLLSIINTAASGEKIPVIVTLVDKADLSPFIAKSRAVRMMSAAERREHRAGIIRALKTKADVSQRRLIKFLKTSGSHRIKPLWTINGLSLKASPEIIQTLAAMPEIASIRPDRVVHLPEVVPAATGGVEDNIIAIKAPDLWSLGFEGQGMVVALLDSGVDYLHPDLATNLPDGSGWRGGTNSWFNPVEADCDLPGANCTPCDANVDTPCDFLDSQNIAHGTGVAGIMTGSNAGGTLIGVAPAAQWIAAKIFKSDETATYTAIHQALGWALDPDGDPDTDDAPDVVNNSWGLIPDPTDPTNRCFTEFLPDIQALKAAGIAVVFSAGNEGPAIGTDVSPGNYQESFAVGSVGTPLSATEISVFSSRGPSTCDGTLFPEVVAPGFPIRSTDFSFGGLALYNNGLTGTSFAAPHVAGVMTLLLQAFPGVSLEDLEDAIKFSATDLGNSGPDNDYGFGLVNALAGYDLLLQAPSTEVRVISPNGGEALISGAPYFISWRGPPDAATYTVRWSRDGGRWKVIAKGVTGNSVEWTTPATPSDNNLIRVIAFDARGNRLSADRSDSPFTITPPVPPDPTNNTLAFVQQLYLDFTRSPGDPVEIQLLVNQIDSAALTRAEAVEFVMLSPESSDIWSPLIRLYSAFFLRIPDYSGLVFWFDALKQGATLWDTAQFFSLSAEFQVMYGSLTNEEYVTLVYANVLDRTPEAGGFAFWTGELNDGTRDRGDCMVDFSESPEYMGNTVNGVYIIMAYAGLLLRAPTQFEYDTWLLALDDGTHGVTLIDDILNSAEYAARF
jgi:serine protease AprX